MKVFIDFDDVVFNTKKFNMQLRDFYADNGVSQEIVQKHYYDPNDTSQIKLFDPWGMLDRLQEFEKIDVSKLRENFAKHLEDLSDFLFEDVVEFLNNFGKENIFLISFGLPVFQNEKIIGSGINKYVNGCVVTRGLKSLAIKEVIKKMKFDQDEKVVFIDDRIEQIRDIKIAYPNSCTMLLCRKDGRYCDQGDEYCDHEVHDLKEVWKIIKNDI